MLIEAGTQSCSSSASTVHPIMHIFVEPLENGAFGYVPNTTTNAFPTGTAALMEADMKRGAHEHGAFEFDNFINFIHHSKGYGLSLSSPTSWCHCDNNSACHQKCFPARSYIPSRLLSPSNIGTPYCLARQLTTEAEMKRRGGACTLPQSWSLLPSGQRSWICRVYYTALVLTFLRNLPELF